MARSARILEVDCDADGALEIASRSRGTPRIANRMLKRVRDFAQMLNDGRIDRPTAQQALTRMEVDELGLDAGDRRMLTAMIRHYNGGPVGLETGRHDRRGSRDHRGCVGTIPDADRLPRPHPPRPCGCCRRPMPIWGWSRTDKRCLDNLRRRTRWEDCLEPTVRAVWPIPS